MKKCKLIHKLFLTMKIVQRLVEIASKRQQQNVIPSTEDQLKKVKTVEIMIGGYVEYKSGKN